VKSLSIITATFLPPIKTLVKDKHLSDADFKSLFSNIEVILQFNSEFYKELKASIDNWGPMQLLGPIFLKLVSIVTQKFDPFVQMRHLLELLFFFRFDRKILNGYLHDIVRPPF